MFGVVTSEDMKLKMLFKLGNSTYFRFSLCINYKLQKSFMWLVVVCWQFYEINSL